MGTEKSEGTYGALGYERFVDWPARLEQEGPFLRNLLGSAPGRRVLDLGCGTGEHARFLADAGFEATGVDSSGESIRIAQEKSRGKNLRFRRLDLAQIESVEGQFDAALCLGNTLPHLNQEQKLNAFFEGLSRILVSGGLFLLQMLNYEKLLEKRWHQIPPRIQEWEEGKRLLLVRLMDFPGERAVRFCPSILSWSPGESTPLKTLRSDELELRAWSPDELTAFLKKWRFEPLERLGTLSGEEYRADSSPNLILLARRL